jgi:hypothetical protein
MVRSLNLALCLAVLLAGQPSAPDPRFGAVESYQAPDLATSAGVGWDRLIVHWSDRQPDNPDQWIVPAAETEALDRAQSAGREVVILLMGTPRWATDGNPLGGVPRGLDQPLDDPNNLWAAFVRRMAATYVNRVHHWIIWNEPDIVAPAFGVQFDGSVEDYYQLLKTAYLAVHEIDSQSVIHLAGLTYWHDVVYGRPSYLQRLLDVAAQDPDSAANHAYFDVFTAHIYFRTDSVAEIVTAFRRILRRNGLNTPIWINETNAPPDDDPNFPATPLLPVTMDQQAAFIVQANALALGLGVERIAVYKLVDDPTAGQPGSEPYGLFRADGSPRPAAGAFETVAKLFAYTRATGCVIAAGYYLVTLRRSGALIRVAWARTARPISLRLRAAVPGSATLYDDAGQGGPVIASRGYYTLSLPGADCTGKDGCVVGGAPAILFEALPAR